MNARRAHDEQFEDDVEIALFSISHPALDEPVRLSTDPTERLGVDPLMYGTRSTWDGANPITEPYLFVLAAAEQPSDLEDAPAAGRITLENVDNRIAETLRGFTNRAEVKMAVVRASAVNEPDAEYHDMRLMSAGGDAGEVQLEFSRQPIEEEVVPMERFTKDRFPGLFR
jgi:hypothetical protein